MKKILNISLSFLMVFSLAFTTIEIVNSQPALANSSAFLCKASNGNLYGYQTEQTSSSLNVYRFDVETGVTNLAKSYSRLNGIYIGNFREIKASAMDDQGNLFAIAYDRNRNLIPYHLKANSSRPPQVGKAIGVGIATYDAATYFDYNGYKYIVAGKGFFGGAKGWRITNAYGYGGSDWPTVSFNIDSSSVSSSTKLPTVDDIAWIRDGSAWPSYSGLSPSFVGYSTKGEKVVLGYITSATKSTVNIKLTSHTLSRPSGWSAQYNVGAVFAFGGEEVYAVYNKSGEVRKISYNGSSFSFGTSLGEMQETSKNDGAACHTGTPKQYWEPSASLVGVSSCSGEGKKLQVSLRNPSLVGKNGAPAIHAATYSSTDGQSGTLYSFTQGIGQSVTYYPDPAFANGSVVTVNYTITNANDTTEVRSGTLTQTIDASECVTTPTDPDSTFSQSLGTCSASSSSGTQTSTLSITNNASSTTYYKVEYSLNGGSSYTVKAANLSIAAGQTDTSMTQAVTHGQQIIWRVTDSDISNTFTGQSAELVSPSAVVSCILDVNAGETFAGCNTLGSASEGTLQSKMTFYNRESQVVYAYSDIRIDGGDWQVKGYQNAIPANGSFVRTQNSVADGSTYQWRWRFGTSISDLNAASWIEGPVNSAVDCPTQLGSGFSSTLGACGAESPNTQRLTLTPSNAGPSAETSAYFYVQIKLNGSDWTTLNGAGWDNLEIAAGATASPAYSVSLSDGDTFDVRYAIQNHPHTETPTSFTNVSWAPSGTQELTIDCPSVTIATSVSVANGSCSGTTFGFMPQVFTMNNGSGADTVAYYRVQYNKNSAGWVTAVENQSVDIDSSQTYTLEDLMVGDTIAWRYYALNTSLAIPSSGVDPVSDSDYTTVSSPPTPGDGCSTAATIASTALGTCSGASVDSTLSIDINTYTDNFENGDDLSTGPVRYYVQYQIDDGAWTNHTAETAPFGSGTGRNLVNATATFTQAVPDGSTINWRYQAKPSAGSFAAIADAPVISANEGQPVECPYINPTAASAIGSCLQSVSGTNDGPATSTFTMQNANATRNAYFFVEYKINDGDWIEKDTNKQVAKDATETLTVNIPHGSKITWRYKSSITPRDFSTGSYTTLAESAAVNCPVIVVTATLSPTASCQDGVFTSFLTIQNEDTANTAAYVEAFYSFDNSTWTAATFSTADVSNLEIADNTAKTLDGVVVPGGSTIYWRYRASATSNTFSGSYVTTGPNSTALSIAADCPLLEPTSSVVLGACSGSSRTSILTIDNSLSNISGFFKVEYSFGDDSWGEAATNDEIGAGASATFLADVPTGSSITWRYQISDTSNTFTEDYIVTASSDEVSCYTTGSNLEVGFGTGCGYPDAVGNFNASVPLGVQTGAFFDVLYRTDMEGPFIPLGSTIVAPGETIAIGNIVMAYGTSIQWMYKVTAEENGDGIFYTTDVASAEYTSYDPCKPDPPVTTTTTTTIPIVEPIFKPIITNVRACNDDGTASYGLTVDNTNSNVSLSITTLMKIDNVTVVNTNYQVASGQSKFITTIASVPEGSYYRIKFFVSDGAGGGTSVGVFKKITDCYEDTSDSTTTTTSPPLTTPESEEPQQVCDTGFDGSCDTPLTEDDGNDFFEWDDYDEEVYLTDGNYVVQYVYTEDEIPVAATGIFQDLYVFYFVVFSSAGIVLINWLPRRRRD
ncbi:hypothetical protein N9T60_02045 [Candidatus Actinomarina]|nr:hypothetical protein [Candidatus Actinomarina sp.]